MALRACGSAPTFTDYAAYVLDPDDNTIEAGCEIEE